MTGYGGSSFISGNTHRCNSLFWGYSSLLRVVSWDVLSLCQPWLLPAYVCPSSIPGSSAFLLVFPCPPQTLVLSASFSGSLTKTMKSISLPLITEHQALNSGKLWYSSMDVSHTPWILWAWFKSHIDIHLAFSKIFILGLALMSIHQPFINISLIKYWVLTSHYLRTYICKGKQER